MKSLGKGGRWLERVRVEILDVTHQFVTHSFWAKSQALRRNYSDPRRYREGQTWLIFILLELSQESSSWGAWPRRALPTRRIHLTDGSANSPLTMLTTGLSRRATVLNTHHNAQSGTAPSELYHEITSILGFPSCPCPHSLIHGKNKCHLTDDRNMQVPLGVLRGSAWGPQGHQSTDGQVPYQKSHTIWT